MLALNWIASVGNKLYVSNCIRGCRQFPDTCVGSVGCPARDPLGYVRDPLGYVRDPLGYVRDLLGYVRHPLGTR